MPRFDFQCTQCAYTFETEFPFGSQQIPACPQCGGGTEKLIAPPAIHFHGEGFYKTDSKKAVAPKKEEKKKEDKKIKGDQKPDTKDQQTKEK